MFDGLLQPTHLIVAIMFIAIFCLIVRGVRNAWRTR